MMINLLKNDENVEINGLKRENYKLVYKNNIENDDDDDDVVFGWAIK